MPDCSWIEPMLGLFEEICRTGELVEWLVPWSSFFPKGEIPLSLWAGLPMLTLPGNYFSARVGSALVSSVGLPQLHVHSLKSYADAIHNIARASMLVNCRAAGLHTRRPRHLVAGPPPCAQPSPPP